MSIKLVCPHCGAIAMVGEQFSGQSGLCARCGKAVVVPFLDGRRGIRSKNILTMLLIMLGVLLAAGILGAAILAALLTPAAYNAREAANRAQCVNNLMQLAIALQTYETVNGSFPPAYVADGNGKPMYSWRVLLLPYLGEQQLADRYNFNKPWNSPHNRKITNLPIETFRCPSQTDTETPLTNYMMIVGDRTISSGPAPRKILDITDGLSKTIMLVEVADSKVHWAEPVDLKFDELDFDINGDKQPGISSRHREGVNAVFCDGSIRLLTNSTDPQLIKAMATIDGGEKLPTEP